MLQLGDAEGWLKQEEAKQSKLKQHENPTMLSTAIDAKIETLRAPFNKLKDRKKPKPPPAPKANSTSEGSQEGSGPKSDPVEDEVPLEENPPWEADADLAGNISEHHDGWHYTSRRSV